VLVCKRFAHLPLALRSESTFLTEKSIQVPIDFQIEAAWEEMAESLKNDGNHPAVNVTTQLAHLGNNIPNEN
jgi:hypothetical protein